MFIFFLIAVVALVVIIVAIKKIIDSSPRHNDFCSDDDFRPERPYQSHYQNGNTGNAVQTDTVDSWNPPSNLSSEEKEHIKKIADFCGVRYITNTEVKKYIIHRLGEDFASMPGWDVWDASIHEASGQFKRAERASLDKSISVLCYDPKYQLAKIQGKTGIYLTSCNRCSCPDFRKRRLPCKHMYALAFELDGDIQQEILDSNHAPLYGLVLALVGHLPRSSKGTGGIRADISDRGGKWSDNMDEFDSSAAVVGKAPSIRRLELIKSFDIEILTPESIKDLFTPHKGTIDLQPNE